MPRLTDHPVLPALAATEISISWRGRSLPAHDGEPLSSALWAAGERVLGHHPKDGAAQSLFCANGQCAQCLVLVDGRPEKACVTRAREGMRVEPADGLPELPKDSGATSAHALEELAVDVLIVGGGPAGLSAAKELGERGIDALLIDDKPILGGKLVLQTHRFFGSFNAVHAGTRGFDIAARLEREVREQPTVRVWTESPAVGAFSDGVVGVLHGGERGSYVLVRPRALVVATGARERSLSFPGNTLPGVMGAGAFQTLMNRDRVLPAERVLVVGGGNVGLIVAYQALQAGVRVAALIEALPECGGYAVHHDKLARLGVEVLTSHTLLAAHGRDSVEGASVARVDEAGHPLPGTERSIACDAVLLAVGLEPENELFRKASELGFSVFAAGDAAQVAEASAALFSGRIAALEAARAVGLLSEDVPEAWRRSLIVHGSRPGPRGSEQGAPEAGVVPVIHCVQEIPCDPCASVCKQGGLVIDPDDIRHLPRFVGDALGRPCVGCEKCVTICPGQAVTLVDYRHDPEHPTVIVPFEMPRAEIGPGSKVTALDIDGHVLGELEVVRVRDAKVSDHTLAIRVRAPRDLAQRVAGVRVGGWPAEGEPERFVPQPAPEAIVCRCERVSADELRARVRAGEHDVHVLKVLTRVGMGACGARTCWPLVQRLLCDAGVAVTEVVEPRHRPPLFEVRLGALADAKSGPERGGA
ncbi:MAG: FAD-dependent oxidoreductase [Myxococcales bacterium]|nr:FAD-dependent oxidoreductase [Myxococcales bacterium]